MKRKKVAADMDQLKMEVLEYCGPQHIPLLTPCTPDELRAALSCLIEEGLVKHVDKTTEEIRRAYVTTEKAHHLMAVTPFSPNSQPGGVMHHQWQDLIRRAEEETRNDHQFIRGPL